MLLLWNLPDHYLLIVGSLLIDVPSVYILRNDAAEQQHHRNIEDDVLIIREGGIGEYTDEEHDTRRQKRHPCHLGKRPFERSFTLGREDPLDGIRIDRRTDTD